jgi:hypothetical protein
LTRCFAHSKIALAPPRGTKEENNEASNKAFIKAIYKATDEAFNKSIKTHSTSQLIKHHLPLENRIAMKERDPKALTDFAQAESLRARALLYMEVLKDFK